MIKKFASILTSLCIIIIMLNAFVLVSPTVSAAEIAGFANYDVYNIKNAGSGKYLNVHNGIDANETNVYQWTKDSSTEQKFAVEYVPSTDSYRLRTMCSSDGNNRLLDIAKLNNSIVSGCNVQINPLGDPAAQEWKFVYVSSGKYKIVTQSNQNLALTSYGTSNGTSGGRSSTSAGNVFVSTYTGSDNQLWYFELLNPSQVISDGIYYLKNKYSGYYMDAANIDGSSTNVHQWSFTGFKNQQWKVAYVGSGYYSIKPWYNYELSLDIQDANDNDGTNVQICAGNGTNAQLFRIIYNGDGSCRISPKCTYDSKVVEVDGGFKNDVGGNCKIWQYAGSDNQKWYFDGYKVTENSDSNANSNYNRTAAKNYAEQYAVNANPYYPEFKDDNDIPEDCANFASQCLTAGGMQSRGVVFINDQANYNNWFYGIPYSGISTSYSWSGSPLFAKHWGTQNGSGLQRAQLTIEFPSPNALIKNWNYFYNNILNGDIIQLIDTTTGKPYHTMVINSDTEWNNTHQVPDVFYAQHTDNKLNCSLYDVMILNAGIDNDSCWTVLVHIIRS